MIDSGLTISINGRTKLGSVACTGATSDCSGIRMLSFVLYTQTGERLLSADHPLTITRFVSAASSSAVCAIAVGYHHQAELPSAEELHQDQSREHEHACPRANQDNDKIPNKNID